LVNIGHVVDVVYLINIGHMINVVYVVNIGYIGYIGNLMMNSLITMEEMWNM
jgi:hypothetical protein